MTTPDIPLPYGITLIPIDFAGYMEVDDSAGPRKLTETRFEVPSSLFVIQVTSTMTGETRLQVLFNDGSPTQTEVIFSGGGRYTATFSGTNIGNMRVGNDDLAANYAAGKRCAVQIIPIPNPI